MATLKLSSPWVIFYREIEALFKYDEEVHVIYDEDENTVRVYVDNHDKADALAQILPSEKSFGSVTLKIIVVPMNNAKSSKDGGAAVFKNDYRAHEALKRWFNVNLFEIAFCGNKALSFIRVVSGVFTNSLIYVVFRNEVVQYFNDSLSDIHGLCSTLFQNIAKDIFDDFENVYFCTDFPEEVKRLPRNYDMWDTIPF